MDKQLFILLLLYLTRFGCICHTSMGKPDF
jgi:hypothetical protein